MDQLKNNHKNPDVKDKAEKAISRIKGWRRQKGTCSTAYLHKKRDHISNFTIGDKKDHFFLEF